MWFANTLTVTEVADVNIDSLSLMWKLNARVTLVDHFLFYFWYFRYTTAVI